MSQHGGRSFTLLAGTHRVWHCCIGECAGLEHRTGDLMLLRAWLLTRLNKELMVVTSASELSCVDRLTCTAHAAGWPQPQKWPRHVVHGQLLFSAYLHATPGFHPPRGSIFAGLELGNPVKVGYSLLCHALQCTVGEAGMHDEKDLAGQRSLSRDPATVVSCGISGADVTTVLCHAGAVGTAQRGGGGAAPVHCCLARPCQPPLCAAVGIVSMLPNRGLQLNSFACQAQAPVPF